MSGEIQVRQGPSLLIDPIGSNSAAQESIVVATFMSEIAESQISSQEDMVQTAERVESLVVNNRELVELQARQIQQLENKIVQLQEMMSDRDALSEARFRALEERLETVAQSANKANDYVKKLSERLRTIEFEFYYHSHGKEGPSHNGNSLTAGPYVPPQWWGSIFTTWWTHKFPRSYDPCFDGRVQNI